MTQSNPKPTLEQRAAELVAAHLHGIDQGEIDHPDGWWETSTGVEFGTRVKADITAAILAFAQSVAAESAPRWIPVEERLPEPNLVDEHDGDPIEYVVTGYAWNDPKKGRFIMTAHFTDEGWLDYTTDGDTYSPYPPTHWQPLPAAPTEGKS